ncbi:hypothetical protein ANTPLA_LOCUS6306 [Anthophora plagiata]
MTSGTENKRASQVDDQVIPMLKFQEADRTADSCPTTYNFSRVKLPGNLSSSGGPWIKKFSTTSISISYFDKYLVLAQ